MSKGGAVQGGAVGGGWGSKAGALSTNQNPLGIHTNFNQGAGKGSKGGTYDSPPIYQDPTLQGNLGDYKNLVGQYNDQFLNNKYGDMANTQMNTYKNGGADPAFNNYKQAQMGMMDYNQGQAMNRQNADMARSGVTGSATLNQNQFTQNQYDVQRQQLAGNVGMQQMQRGDTAFMNAAGLYDQGLNTTSAGLTNAASPIALQIANQSSINSGITPPVPKGKKG